MRCPSSMVGFEKKKSKIPEEKLCFRRYGDTAFYYWINQDLLKSAVGYPDGEVSNIVVALGYSDIPKREKVRKSAEEVITIL